jgi:hypothetical protein
LLPLTQATLVRGAFGADNTGASRSFLLGLFTCPSVDPLAPIVRFLVLVDFGKFCG